MSDKPPPAVGIDLGTTYSVVAYLDEHGRPESVRNGEGDITTPSVVFFDRDTVLVGKEAILAAEHEPERVARFAKRDMGGDAFAKRIRGERFPPEVVQALVLRKLREDAERGIGPFTRAVITVPAYFNEPRRKATQDAARLAGLEPLDIVNEPTAAAITFGIQQGFLDESGESTRRETILVYDLGGGTFDATLMEIDGRRYDCLGTLGEMHLGGIDFDRRLVDHLAERFQAEHGADPRATDTGYEVLLHKAVEAKHALSSRAEVPVRFAIDGKSISLDVSRETFESLTSDLLVRTTECVRRLLEMTGRTWSDLTQLVLVGGSTRMPAVHAALARESGLTVDRSLSPDEAVAHGAAVYAGLLLRTDDPSGPPLSIANVNSHDLGVLGVGGGGKRIRRVIVPRNTPLPVTRTETSKTAKFDQRSVRIDVVEGGDDTGVGATAIGRCVVRDLPPELPAGTPVEVVFTYEGNGRLSVEGVLPTVNRRGALAIERAAGLSEGQLAHWEGRIEAGLTDANAPAAAEPPPASPPAAEPLELGAEEAASAEVTSPAAPAEPPPESPPPKPVKKLKKLKKRPKPEPAQPVAEPVAEVDVEPDVQAEAFPVLGDGAVAEPAEEPAEEKPAKPSWRSRAKKLSGDDG